jgi:hypothetical protein
MRWAEFRGPGLANRLQTTIFGDSSGICKTRIQQQHTAAAEFGTFLLKTAMAHMEIRNEKPAAGMNLRSHSLDKLRQIVTTGALRLAHMVCSRAINSPTVHEPAAAAAGARARPPPPRRPRRRRRAGRRPRRPAHAALGRSEEAVGADERGWMCARDGAGLRGVHASALASCCVVGIWEVSEGVCVTPPTTTKSPSVEAAPRA